MNYNSALTLGDEQDPLLSPQGSCPRSWRRPGRFGALSVPVWPTALLEVDSIAPPDPRPHGHSLATLVQSWHSWFRTDTCLLWWPPAYHHLLSYCFLLPWQQMWFSFPSHRAKSVRLTQSCCWNCLIQASGHSALWQTDSSVHLEVLTAPLWRVSPSV